MNVLGYLITLANLQNFQDTGGPLKDLSIKVAEIQTLYDELIAIPGLELNGFKDTGYYRYKSMGKYLSNNLRDYMYNGVGKPKDEGVILTLYFDENNGQGILNDDDDTLSLFLHKEIGDEERDQVQEYLDEQYIRNKRAVDVLVAKPVDAKK